MYLKYIFPLFFITGCRVKKIMSLYCTCLTGIWGNGGIASFILNLGTSWRGGAASSPGCFIPGKRPFYTLSRRLGGHRMQSGCFGEQKNILPLPAYEFQSV
jgi:hypothetical protein